MNISLHFTLQYIAINITTMAGYGNRTAPDYVAENLQEEHTSTRLGLTDSNAAYSNAHSKHGSGATGGAGFGKLLSSLTQQLPLQSTHLLHPFTDSPIPTPSLNTSNTPPGNKRSSFSTSTSAPSSSSEEEQFRFGLHKDTSPYSHATPHGSGSTGGAGFGNKTGSFSESHDSTVGKVLEKAGHVVHSVKLEEKGAAMREKAGLGSAAE